MYKKREQPQPQQSTQESEKPKEKPITIGSTQFEEEEEDNEVDDEKVVDGLTIIEEGDEIVGDDSEVMDDEDDNDVVEEEEDEHLKKLSFVADPTKRSHSRYKRINLITRKLRELSKVTGDEYLLIHVNVLGRKNSKTSKKRFACTKKMRKLLKVGAFMQKLVELFEKRD